MPWRLTEGQRHGNPANSHNYKRTNTDSPFLRNSFAAVRMTVAEANTEVCVSAGISVGKSPTE